MKTMGRLLILFLPVLALTAFFIVMKQWGGIAPAAPISETTLEPQISSVTHTAQRAPTVLAPVGPGTDELPPGTDRWSGEGRPRAASVAARLDEDLTMPVLPPVDTGS